MASPYNAHKAGLAWILETGEFSDCTIACGPYTFLVHKAIVSAQSEYLRKAFREGTFKEGEEGKITLPAGDDPTNGEDDPEIVKLMVEYFHKLIYHPEDPVANLPIMPPPRSDFMKAYDPY